MLVIAQQLDNNSLLAKELCSRGRAAEGRCQDGNATLHSLTFLPPTPNETATLWVKTRIRDLWETGHFLNFQTSSGSESFR